MNVSKSDGEYEIINPWADRDPVPSKGLATRIDDLAGKTIGLYRNDKRSSKPTLDYLEGKLRAKFPTATFSSYLRLGNVCIQDTDKMSEFEKWLEELDTVIFAYGD